MITCKIVIDVNFYHDIALKGGLREITLFQYGTRTR